MDSERRTDELKLPEGVTIRTHKSGRQAIQVAFTFNGHHCRETLKGRPVSRTHLRFAGDLVSRIRSEIATGQFNYERHFPESKAVRRFNGKAATLTVSELMDEFITLREAAWEPSSLKAVKSMTAIHIKKGIGKYRVAELTTTQIAAWLRSPEMSGYSLKFVRNLISPLRLAMFHAVHEGYRNDNPAAAGVLNVKLLVPKSLWASGTCADPFSNHEIKQILAHCGEPAFENFVRFAFATGLRTGELIALKWRNVDFAKRLIHVERAIVDGYEKGTKTRKGARFVTLNDEAVMALKSQILLSSEKKRVFFHPSTGLAFSTAAQIYYLWTRMIEQAEVRFRPPMQTRHSFASAHITAGCNLFWLADQLGHEGTDMINRHYGAFIKDNAASTVAPRP